MSIKWTTPTGQPDILSASSAHGEVCVVTYKGQYHLCHDDGIWEYSSLPAALLAGEELLKDSEHWKTRRKSVSIAFDGCIHSYLSPWTTATEINDPPTHNVAVRLRLLSKTYDITVVSGRANHPDGLAAVMTWLSEHRLDQYISKVVPTAYPSNFIGPNVVRFEGAWNLLLPETPWNRKKGWKRHNQERLEFRSFSQAHLGELWPEEEESDRFDGVGSVGSPANLPEL